MHNKVLINLYYKSINRKEVISNSLIKLMIDLTTELNLK